MPLVLVALDDGPDILLDRPLTVVGRDPRSDARLDSILVSRRHCCLATDRGEVEVRDLGSTNGIRINGLRVEAGRLRPGDELAIGRFRFRLSDVPACGVPSAAAGSAVACNAGDAHKTRD